MTDLQPICDGIRYWHRERCVSMEQRKRIDLSMMSFLRFNAFGWRKDLPLAERKAISEKTMRLVGIGEAEYEAVALIAKGEDRSAKENRRLDKLMLAETSDPVYVEFHDVIQAFLASRDPWDGIEARATSNLEQLATTLPVWPLLAIKGFGVRSLGVIVGETGDISNYPTVSKLWKRLGLAVIDGKRQGGLPKTAPKEEWIKHGYSKLRRSRMFVIGDVLIKSDNKYRQIYLDRKVYEKAIAEAKGLTVAPTAKIPAKRKAEFMSEGHVHRRAQRYMEKCFLRDLWAAWREASQGLEPNMLVPPVDFKEAA